ncbi:transposase [Roseateles sp. So40a]|uniref:transposase n=1 Tax=Roseateles sp. So40a TaxID=3400226 RepID=UPI003A8B7666
MRNRYKRSSNAGAELVTSLKRVEGKFVAYGTGTGRARLGIGADHLTFQGIPNNKPDRMRVESEFKNWKPASLLEYCCALSMDLDGEPSHETWAFVHNGMRVVVPALVLMRALLRPHDPVFDLAFKSHSIDAMVTYTGDTELSSGETVVSVVQSYRYSAATSNKATILEPLSWAYSFPSARQMWNSIYAHATHGRIAMQLPHAWSHMVVHGVAHARNFYVTQLAVVSLEPREEPFEFASGHARVIKFHEALEVVASGLKPLRTKDDSIKLHSNRTSALSDAEWSEIAPLFSRGGSHDGKTGNVHDQRLIVDGILAKLTAGTSWTETTYAQGIPHTSVSIAYHRWQKSGRWEAIISTLNKHRI